MVAEARNSELLGLHSIPNWDRRPVSPDSPVVWGVTSPFPKSQPVAVYGTSIVTPSALLSGLTPSIFFVLFTRRPDRVKLCAGIHLRPLPSLHVFRYIFCDVVQMYMYARLMFYVILHLL